MIAESERLGAVGANAIEAVARGAESLAEIIHWADNARRKGLDVADWKGEAGGQVAVDEAGVEELEETAAFAQVVDVGEELQE